MGVLRSHFTLAGFATTRKKGLPRTKKGKVPRRKENGRIPFAERPIFALAKISVS